MPFKSPNHQIKVTTKISMYMVLVFHWMEDNAHNFICIGCRNQVWEWWNCCAVVVHKTTSWFWKGYTKPGHRWSHYSTWPRKSTGWVCYARNHSTSNLMFSAGSLNVSVMYVLCTAVNVVYRCNCCFVYQCVVYFLFAFSWVATTP